MCEIILVHPKLPTGARRLPQQRAKAILPWDILTEQSTPTSKRKGKQPERTANHGEQPEKPKQQIKTFQNKKYILN
jgi:hypothetical protein